jgi:hypothetical protein
MEVAMGLAAYAVKRVDDGWGIEHDGRVEGSYLTKESAFLAIAAAASDSIKEGHEILITVPGRVGDEPALRG